MMSKEIYYFAVIYFLTLSCIESAHIGITSYPGATSHNYIASKIARALLERGHKVSFFPAKIDDNAFGNLTGIHYHPYDPPYTRNVVDRTLKEVGELDPVSGLVKLIDFQLEACESLLKDVNIRDYLERNPIDLLIMDNTCLCSSLFADSIKVDKRVAMGIIGYFDPFFSSTHGVPFSISYNPTMGSGLPSSMSFIERLSNSFLHFVNVIVHRTLLLSPADQLRMKFGITPTSTAESLQNSLVLYQTTFGLEFPRAIPPNVKNIGPLLPTDPKPLPPNEDLTTWMDNSKDGVIVVAFGTVVISSQETNEKMIHVFEKLPINVIWKLRADNRQGIPQKLPGNIRLEEWIPQNDLLGHPNTKVFLTHCGINGVHESIFNEIPMVGLPQIADQWDNCRRLKSAGVGTYLNRDSFTAEQLHQALLEVLSNPSYKEHSKRLSKIIKSSGRMTEAIQWIEYALENGYTHLLPKAYFDLYWFQLIGLDILLSYVALIYVITKFVSYCNCCCKNKSSHLKRKLE